MAAVALEALSKRHAGGAGVGPITLSLERQDRFVFLGPSGAGKTTLLRLIAGLEEADSGRVVFDGRDVTHTPPHRRGVAYLPQRPALYPHLRVREQLDGPTPAVELLKLAPLLDRYPHELSGGEKQRTALARIASRNCPLWLLDEPFAPLDPVLRADFRHDLHLLAASSAATMLIVSHDPIDALALGRRVGVLGDGALQQVGTPDDLYARPGTRFAAAALGQMCFLGQGETDLGLRPGDLLPGADPARGEVLVGWRAVFAEPARAGWVLTVADGPKRLRVAWPDGPPPASGTPVDLTVIAGRGVRFDAATGRRTDD